MGLGKPIDLSGYVGLPFVSGGRDRAGVDCYGLVWLVFRDELGIALPSRSDDYASTADREEVASILASGMGAWREVEPADASALDGVLMTTGGQPAHVGLYNGAGRVLHIERGIGSLLQSVSHPRVASRIAGYFRHESRS